MALKCYAINPIDFDLEFLRTVDEVAKKYLDDCDLERLTVFLNGWQEARKLASDAGWEGDFRGAPRIIFIPFDNYFKIGFIIKQDNGGRTFVVISDEIDLPWLEDIRA